MISRRSVPEGRRPGAREPRLRAAVPRAHRRRSAAPKRKVLVTIFQRGAVDGLNMIVPVRRARLLRVAAEHRDRAARDVGRGRARSRRLLRPAPAARAAQAALRRAAARDRARLRIARRHALALRRAGLHGDRHARRQEHAGRLAESLSARARAREGDAVPRRRDGAAAAALAAGLEPALAIGQIGQFGIRAGQATDMVQASFEAEYAAAAASVLNRTGREAFDAVRMLKHADPSKYAPENGAEYPRTPYGEALKQIAQLDQSRRRPRSRVRRNRQLGSPRAGGSRRRAARQSARRFRRRHRRARARPRRSHERRHHPDDVGVRTDRGRERQSRHRSRPRQRDDGHRRRRARRQGLRQVARPRARAAIRRARPRRHDRFPQRSSPRSPAVTSA